MRPSTLFALALTGAALFAQRTQAPPPAAQVNPDRSVTFRLKAPKASEVSVAGDFGKGPAMSKSEDGTWTGATTPLDPQIYSYSFIVDGVRAIDPSSGFIKPGVSSTSTLFEVPGDAPAFYDPRPVPHGTVHVHWYESKALHAPRSVWVYTPPGYEGNSARYPVLYLLHGSGDTESGWVTVGRANLILDNLFAERKARPMIVAMPFGHTLPSVGLAPLPATVPDRSLFTNDLLEAVLPLVEKTYRVTGTPEDRALAGLSMGGAQTLQIGLTHLDLFRWLGVFSMGMPRAEQADSVFAAAVKDPAATNKRLRLFWIGCGRQDALFESAQKLDQYLAENKIAHAFHTYEGPHAWRVWRNHLHDFAPLLFQPR